MNINRGMSLLFLMLLLVSATTSVFAGVPLVTSYQGRLLDAGDQPLTGSYTMIFQIYDVPVGGAPLWTEDHVGVAVTDGLFSVALGSTVPLSADLLTGAGGGGGGSSRYLQIQIAGQPAISPRTRLSAAPYAVAAGSVSGDIQTENGVLRVSHNIGSSGQDGVEIRADGSGNTVRAVSLNGLPPGQPVIGQVALSSTNDSAGVAIGDLDADGAVEVVSAVTNMGGGASSAAYAATGRMTTAGLDRVMTLVDASGPSMTIDEAGTQRVKLSGSGGSGGGSGGMISITGDPDFDLLRMSADQDSAKIRISGQSSGDPDFDLLRIVGGTGTGTAGASVTLTGDPDFDLLRMSADSDLSKIRLGGKVIGDPDFDLLRLTGGSGSSNLLMQSEPSVDGSSRSLDAACDNTNARLAIKTKGTSAKREIRHNTDSLIAESSVEADLDGDGVAENDVTSSADATSSRMAINSKWPHKRRTVRAAADSIAAKSSVAADLDGDGLEDLVVSSSTDATSAKHAINTKGTGAQAGKSASLTMQATPGGSASAVLDIDDDGDSVPEGEISQSVTPTTSSVAIKTKGTGADANRVVIITGLTALGTSLQRSAIDDDGDSVPESEISQSLTPTTSSVAIKVKGTGADKDRVVSVSSGTYTYDSAGVVACDIDDDGDGISEYKAVCTVTDADGDTGSDMRCVADPDDDGVPDNEASMSVTPTTSSVAIKTKGTGADPNRAASLSCVGDVDGDGTVDRRVHITADSTTAGIAIDEPGAHIAIEARKGWDGTIKGRIAIDESGAHRVLFDSDGDGYLSGELGIGVSAPVHAIDVAGGAYCDGTNWVNASDANAKENFQPVDGSELLDQIEQLAITRWNYKGNDQAEHIGPTAQDFKAAFGVGADDKSISTIDPSGIALAAIKALRIEAKNKTQQLSELQNKVQQLEAMVEKLLSEKK